MTMAKRVRVYGMTLLAVLMILLIAQSVIKLRTEYRATKSIQENRGTVPARLTTDLGSWKGALPLARPVLKVATISTDSNDYAADYEGDVVGGYQWGNGQIFITPEASERVLVHELGHALTFDVVVTYADGDINDAVKVTFDVLTDFDRDSDVDALPEELRAVAAEYQSVPERVYGSPYYTERLSEYIAQSFARYAAGQSVPPVVGGWLVELEREGR